MSDLLHILQVGVVGYKSVIINVEIDKLANARIGGRLQDLILLCGVVLAKTDIKAHNISVKITL